MRNIFLQTNTHKTMKILSSLTLQLALTEGAWALTTPGRTKVSTSTSSHRNTAGVHVVSDHIQLLASRSDVGEGSPGWHRIVLKKVFPRKRKLHMQAEIQSSLLANPGKTSYESYGNALFASRSGNADKVEYSPLFIELNNLTGTSDSSPYLCIQPTQAEDLNRVSDQGEDGKIDTGSISIEKNGSLLALVSRKSIRNFLYDLLDGWSEGKHLDMNVQVDPDSSMIELLGWGYIRAKASVDFSRISFPALQMSHGRIEAHRIALNLYSFLPGHTRFPDQFDFLAKNVTFSQEDLFGSDCIRRGLRSLLRRILKQNENVESSSISNISVDSIKILPTGKLAVTGKTMTPFGASVGFEVRTGLGTKARGHMLTFPGLELSINPTLGWFVPILPEISFDLGHHASIQDIELDGRNRELRVSAMATITPRHRRKFSHEQDPIAFAAHFSYDIGRWLTRIGKFSN